jgi:hypothetical protein
MRIATIAFVLIVLFSAPISAAAPNEAGDAVELLKQSFKCPITNVSLDNEISDFLCILIQEILTPFG